MRTIISFLLIFTTLIANARQISPEEAQAIASDFFNFSTNKNGKKETRRVKQALSPKRNNSKEEPYYIFNADNNAGFIIISGDTRIRKILGYSETGSFDIENMPPQLKWLLGEYEKQFASLSSTSSEDQSWLNNGEQSATEGVLLETADWGQGYPYNMQCPIIDGIQAPSGCVATAMAIIMKYHNWPKSGSGISQDIVLDGFNYDWDKMLMDYSSKYSDEEATAVASLMRHCGAAVKMEYGQYESAAETRCAPFVKYFGFDGEAHEIKRSREKDFEKQIKDELNMKRPVMFAANSNNNFIGHAFVIDGYTDDNYFHINYGWDGLMNGYYYLTPESADSQNTTEFTLAQSAYIGLQPYQGDPLEISIDESNFPAKVCEYLRSSDIDINSDGVLSYNEIYGTDLLYLPNMDLETLGNLNIFRGVTRMHCDNNKLTEVDLKNYPYLTWFSCNNNYLKSLNTSHNIFLEVLDCPSNDLANIDVTGNPCLNILYCHHNKLTTLNVATLSELEHFDCGYNQLVELDITHNPLLKYIRCDYNQIEHFDVSSCPLLKIINCDSNSLKRLDVTKNPLLEIIYADKNNLYTLDVSNNPLLQQLMCSDNDLSILSLINNPNISMLSCYNNKLTELDLSSCPALNDIMCHSNMLNSLVLPVSSTLKDLDFSRNQIKNIDISCNPSLKTLYCYDNKLTELDIQKNTNLQIILCNDNEIEKIEIKDKFYLETIVGSQNLLSIVIINNCPILKTANFDSNPMAYAEVNGVPEECDTHFSTIPLKVETDEMLRFNTSSISGFDINKISNLTGGTIDGNYIIFDNPNNGEDPIVRYLYNSGIKKFEFALSSSKIPNESGIEDILNDNPIPVLIYDTTGTLLYKGKYSDAMLEKGIYIVVSGNKTYKHLIK